VGFDSCIHNPTPAQLLERDKKDRKKYIPVELPLTQLSEADKAFLEDKVQETSEAMPENTVIKIAAFKKFYTTGELMAQAQDFENLFSSPHFDIKYQVYDDGLVGHLFSNMTRPQRDFSFTSFFKTKVPKKETLGEVQKRSVTLPSVDPDPVE